MTSRRFARIVTAIAAYGVAAFCLAAQPIGFEADPAKAQNTVQQVCAACHGTDGRSTAPVNPHLGGQHAEYLYKQLMNFKPQGGKPAERPGPVMSAMVANLSADELRNLAAHYAIQKPVISSARDPKLARLGQTIYRAGIPARGVAACAGCHGPAGGGIPAQYPRIAGQHVDYTVGQLKAFRSSERQNDPNRMMRDQAARLSDSDIAALAEYLSGLR